MEWIDEIKIGMMMLKNACNKNNTWINCKDCPFYKYCVDLNDHGILVPGEWKIDD